MFRLLILFLIVPMIASAATAPSRVATYTEGTEIEPTDVTSNEDSLFTWGQAINDYFSNDQLKNANLAQITTAGKVSGAALTSLSSIPSGAGVIPAANLPASATVSIFVGSFTRDMTLASGTQAITGVGFQPTGVIFFGAVNGTVSGSWGFGTGGTQGVLYRDDGTADETVSSSYALAIFNAASSANQLATVSSYDSDGFTLTWTKNGSPTGTGTIIYFAIK